MNSTIKTLLAHRSIRKFKNQPIETETLELLIRCGQAAASSSFIQAYSVIRVSDAGHRRQIAEAAGGQQWINEAAEFLVFCADLKRIETACVQQGLGKLEGHTEHFLAATVDVALMAENVLLAAESLQLGGVFIGGIRNNPALVAELLELPAQVFPVFGMCLGWPDADPEVKPRLPVSAVLHQDRYQQERIDSDIADYDRQMQEYYRQRSSNNRVSDWSTQTARAVQGKQREHMLAFLQARGFLLK